MTLRSKCHLRVLLADNRAETKPAVDNCTVLRSMWNIFGIVHFPSPYHCGPEIHERNLTSLMGLYGQAHWSMSQNLTHKSPQGVDPVVGLSKKGIYSAWGFNFCFWNKILLWSWWLRSETKHHTGIQNCRAFQLWGNFSREMSFLPCMTPSRELAVSAQFLSISATTDSREEALSGGICSQSLPVFATL